MSVIKKAALVVAAVVCAAVTATPANNSEQVVFSDTGAVMTLVGNSKAATTPFGFWIRTGAFTHTALTADEWRPTCTVFPGPFTDPALSGLPVTRAQSREAR